MGQNLTLLLFERHKPLRKQWKKIKHNMSVLQSTRMWSQPRHNLSNEETGLCSKTADSAISVLLSLICFINTKLFPTLRIVQSPCTLISTILSLGVSKLNIINYVKSLGPPEGGEWKKVKTKGWRKGKKIKSSLVILGTTSLSL